MSRREDLENDARVFVAGYPIRFDRDDIYTYFHKFGKIHRICMKVGYAFIQYYDIEDAKLAIRRLNGHMVQGKELFVRQAKPAPVLKDQNSEHPSLESRSRDRKNR